MTQDIQQDHQPEATPVGHSGTRVVIEERPAWAISGWLGVVVIAACIAGAILLGQGSTSALAVAPAVVGGLVFSSLIIVQPGHTKVVRFFGSYVGTVRRTGLSWILPLADRKSLSIRVRNFETNHLKVNDADGNPVEIAAIVVWQVADTSRASYAVDDYVNFVGVQAESALRHVATTLSPRSLPRRSPSGSRSPAWRLSRCASAISPTPPRSRRRCCADSRPTPSSRRARGSSKAPWEWSKWRSLASRSTASLSSTRSARQRWSATCWSSSAPTNRPPR